MSFYYWMGFIVICGLIYSFFYRKKYYPLNKKLFDYIDGSNFNIHFDSLGVSFKVIGAWEWTYYKLFSDGQAIILIDEYDFDLNPNRKKYADTYLIIWSNQQNNYPIEIFKNLFTIDSYSITKKGSLKLNGRLVHQSIFKSVTWIQQSSNLTITIKAPKDNFDWNKILNKINNSN